MRGQHIKIELDAEARKELEEFSKTGKRSVKLVIRAKIILELDESDGRKPLSQVEIANKLDVSRQTVNDAKKAYIEAESVSSFLQRKKRVKPPIEPKITGEVEAHIIALACGPAPEGYAKWTLQLLADKSVELNYIDSLSPMSVHRLLKKRNLSLT